MSVVVMEKVNYGIMVSTSWSFKLFPRDPWLWLQWHAGVLLRRMDPPNSRCTYTAVTRPAESQKIGELLPLHPMAVADFQPRHRAPADPQRPAWLSNKIFPSTGFTTDPADATRRSATTNRSSAAIVHGLALPLHG